MEKFSREFIYDVLKETQNVNIAFTEEDRQRTLKNPSTQELLKGLREDGEKYRGEPIPTLTFSKFKLHDLTGRREEFDNDYFLRRKRLTAFAMLSWLYGKQEDTEALEDIIWAICDEYTWSLPSHLFFKCLTELQTEETYHVDLFAAETAEALAETLSLVGEKLRPIVVMRAKREIYRRVIDRVLKVEFLWKYQWATNWCAVCNGSSAMAALYLEKDVDKLTDYIKMTTDSLHTFYGSYPDDGACTEGTSYWDFGFGWFVYFAALLKKRTAGKIDLFNDEKIRKMASFPVRVAFDKGNCVAFADSPGGVGLDLASGLITYLSETYDDVKLPSKEFLNNTEKAKHASSRFALTLRNLVWTAYDIENKGVNPTMRTSIFPVAQWYIATSENGVGLAAKGGHNDEAHNHNDVGSFHVFKNGKTMIADLGAPQYVSDYFMPNTRYTFFCASSESHNVPVINGKYQKEGKKYAAREVVIGEDGITMDISGAYDAPELKSLVRALKCNHKTGETTVKDKFVFNQKPSSVIEHILSMVEPIVKSDEVVIENEGEIARILFDKEKFTINVYSHEDLAKGSGAPRKSYVTELIAIDLQKEMEINFKIMF
ncbi:MAG: heparinase II/III family protein [Candidatus Borkfalkiaceae bacterium]|nr:heparinase II/III family protein [Clostridia bacterium]MDY6222752.1 heparinase II/III family protein [Christensenellaceae bacterium]